VVLLCALKKELMRWCHLSTGASRRNKLHYQRCRSELRASKKVPQTSKENEAVRAEGASKAAHEMNLHYPCRTPSWLDAIWSNRPLLRSGPPAPPTGHNRHLCGHAHDFCADLDPPSAVLARAILRRVEHHDKG
jgi:hypothetical protein